MVCASERGAEPRPSSGVIALDVDALLGIVLPDEAAWSPYRWCRDAAGGAGDSGVAVSAGFSFWSRRAFTAGDAKDAEEENGCVGPVVAAGARAGAGDDEVGGL